MHQWPLQEDDVWLKIIIPSFLIAAVALGRKIWATREKLDKIFRKNQHFGIWYCGDAIW